MEIIILLILGILAGIVAGVFGLGGGILFTPILFVVFSNAGIENPVVLTIATSLFCTFIAAIGSSLRQYYQDNFFLKEGLMVGLLGVLGVTLGKQVITSSWYSQREFVIFFSFVLLYVAFMFYRRGSAKPEEAKGEVDRNPIRWGQSLVTGGLGGFIAALAGIGGGGVMVPLMNLYYRKAFARSVSISSLAIVLISLSGWLQLALTPEVPGGTLTPWYMGRVDFGAALPLAVGGLFGGFAGAYINLKLSRKVLQYAFAVLALGMAVRMIVELFI